MSIRRPETALPAHPAQPERKRRVPPRVRDAINELVYGRVKTITAAEEKVGLSRERLSRALSSLTLPNIFGRALQKLSG